VHLVKEQMSMRKAWLIRPVAVAVAAGSVAVAGGVSAAAPTPADACPPAKVSGLTKTLNAFETGSAVGPGVMFGIAVTVLGQPLPGPLGDAQRQLLTAGATAVQTISTQGPAGIEQLRSAVEMFAVYNDYANLVMQAGADNVDAFSTQFGQAIQPFDLTLHQIATIIRTDEEQQTPCGTPTVPGAATPAGQIALAFASGDGPGAAALIKQHDLQSNDAQLGDSVFLGGLASVATKGFDNFRTAVAYAFPHAGVPIPTATQAFGAAATRAVQGGLTPDEAFLGGRTVMDTYQAYLTQGAA
jgi:hypothetical protein